MIGSYSNPIRGMERRLAPDFASREFRDPGLRGMGGSNRSGLGSLHRTMPHLRRLNPSIERMQSGGTLNPVGLTYAESRPNLYNPDPMRRRILRELAGLNTATWRGVPGSTEPLPYAEGGETDDSPQDLMQPDDQQSEPDDEEHQVVVEAMAALEGQADDPEEALAHFIDLFGPRALKDLQQMLESKHQDEQQDPSQTGDEDDQDQDAMFQQMGGSPDEETEMAGASGGLLSGPGTGQSDEIEGVTPSGRPVLLSDGEYVFDAPTVAALGDGSTNAGARRLDALRKQIRSDSYGHDKQAKPMRQGGITF